MAQNCLRQLSAIFQFYRDLLENPWQHITSAVIFSYRYFNRFSKTSRLSIKCGKGFWLSSTQSLCGVSKHLLAVNTNSFFTKCYINVKIYFQYFLQVIKNSLHEVARSLSLRESTGSAPQVAQTKYLKHITQIHAVGLQTITTALQLPFLSL